MADNTIANAIKFLKGEEKSLPATKTEGQVYFAYKDVGTAEKPSYTGAIYIDTPIGGTQTRIKMTANADIADKAFNDSAGLNIRNTYLSSLGYTDDGKQTILIKGSGNNQTRIALPIASLIKSGIVTTDAQSFGGTKTFITINSTNLTVTGSSSFSYTGIETATSDKARPVWFAYDGINGKPVVNTNFTYNPATQTLSVANLSGTADKATKDDGGQDIRSTYVKYKTIKFSAVADKVYLLEGNGAGSTTAVSGANISTAIIPAATDKAAGVITATTQTFSGNKTFNDNVYINQLIAGKSIDGWTASQFIIIPKVHYNALDSTHTTETYLGNLIKWICQKYPNREGYTYIGQAIPNATGNVSIYIYNTSDLKNGYPRYAVGFFYNLGGTISSFGTNEYGLYYREGLMNDNNFAGSTSPNGAATSANKLNTNAGSTARPVYFSGGIPIQCDDTLANSITGSAYRLFIGPPEDKKAGGLYMFQKNGDTNFCPSDNWWSILRTQHPGYDNGYWQEMAYSFHDSRICFRRNINGAKTPWKDIAFTDSDITGKSASTDALNWTHGNEIRFTKPSYTEPQSLHFGWAWTDGSQVKLISDYVFDGGNGQQTQVTASQFNGNLNGNANTATALTSSAGSSTQPVYFSGGKPVACAYTINASVPSGAKFTDTWRGIQNNVISDSTTDSLSAAQGKYLKGLIDGKLSLSGGIMTGDIGLPRTPSTIDGSVPYAGSTVTTDDIATFSSYKTYLGTYMNSERNWRNIISIRHRNGAKDGTSYGMMIYTALTDVDSLRWDKQMGGKSWQGERIILDSSNYTSYTVTKSGSGASGTWGINISGSSTSCTGNAATATKLQTARTISLTGSVTGSGTFDGSGNLSITTSTNHSHGQYLPLAGGTMTGSIGYGAKGYCYVGSGTSDAANMVGGELNNLVISSWQGISFTTTCSSTFTSKNAVSIDCRNGVLAAASLRVGNGSGSTINFCTNGGTAAPGAKIVAYNDRIEFVFA